MSKFFFCHFFRPFSFGSGLFFLFHFPRLPSTLPAATYILPSLSVLVAFFRIASITIYVTLYLQVVAATEYIRKDSHMAILDIFKISEYQSTIQTLENENRTLQSEINDLQTEVAELQNFIPAYRFLK